MQPAPLLTAGQIIVKQPLDLRGRRGSQFLDGLFDNLCKFAESHYTYSATKLPGSGGAVLLSKPSSEHAQVDCASLAEAFVLLAKGTLQVSDVEKKCVGDPCSFATRAGTKCFDPQIVGNMRTKNGTYVQTARCVFREHWFARAGNKFYDACLLTTYANEKEVKDWTFVPAFKQYNGKVFLIQEDPTKFVIRIPAPLPPAPGFKGAMLICDTKDWNKAEYQDAFRKPKPSWQLSTKSINQLLKEAGISMTYGELR